MLEKLIIQLKVYQPTVMVDTSASKSTLLIPWTTNDFSTVPSTSFSLGSKVKIAAKSTKLVLRWLDMGTLHFEHVIGFSRICRDIVLHPNHYYRIEILQHLRRSLEPRISQIEGSLCYDYINSNDSKYVVDLRHLITPSITIPPSATYK